MIPKIGIPTPTTIDPAYNQRSWPAYATAVARAGGDPIELPLNLPTASLEALAATCHGFLLPGSPADVDPTLYDTPRLPACGPQDALREQTDFALLTHAAATGKPLLGICYGCQSMNVFHGGSLIQDLSPLPVNHSAGASVAIAHSVLVPADTTLVTLLQAFPETTTQPTTEPSAGVGAPPLSAAERVDSKMWAAKGADPQPTHLRLPVNTSHHQSVAIPAPNLRIAARCPDDEVIEAIELDPTVFHVEQSSQRFLLGVQWHPERSIDISPASRALFHALITTAQPNP